MDLTPTSIVANVPMVIATSPRSGMPDLGTLLARIRERGDGVPFGTPGTGTRVIWHRPICSLTGQKAMLVPYRGAAPAMSNLAASTMDAVIDQTVTMIPAHLGHTAVALAVTGDKRIAQLPDVPTFAEAGVSGFDMVIWNVIAGLKNMPSVVVQRMIRSIDVALANSKVVARFADLTTEAPPPEQLGPDAMRRRIASNVDRWKQVVQASGIALQ